MQIIENNITVTDSFVRVAFKANLQFTESDRPQKLFFPPRLWNRVREKLGFTGNWAGARTFAILQKHWDNIVTSFAQILYTTNDGVYIYFYSRGTGTNNFVYIDEVFA